MGLSCSCDFDGDGWYYYPSTNFSSLQTKRRRRCCSCKELISVGSEVLTLNRFRAPNNDIEESIYGDEVPLADKHLCEECGGLFMALEDLGFCISIGEPMKSLVAEYNSMRRNGYI